MKKALGRGRACFWPLGFLFALATALGLRLNRCGQTGWGALALCLGAALIVGPLLGECFFGLARFLCRARKPLSLSRQKAFRLSFAALLLCWLPVLLAFYPGITGYDIDNQLAQILSGEYQTNHPLLHTLLIGGCVKLLGYTDGYGLYTCIQTLLLALSVAYAMGCLAGMRIPRWLWIGLMGFFCLAPQHGVMAVSGTKDVLFSAAMLLLVVELLSPPEGWMGWLRVLLFATLVGLLRNGVVWAVGIGGSVLLVFGLRKTGWRLPVCLIAAAVLALGGNTGLKAVLNVQPTGMTGELLSIPCQQLARVYMLSDADELEKEEILSRVPFAADYEPWLADNAKQAVYFGFKPQRLVSFLKLWVREGLRYPIEYIDAFLLTNKGYWDVGDDSFTTIYDHQPNDAKGVLMLRHVQGTPIEERSLLPGLKTLWKRLFAENQYKRIPLVGLLLHPAVFTWLIAFLFAFTLWKRQGKLVLLCGAILLETLLKLFGPCCLIRYQYDLMLIAPVLLGAVAVPAKEEP